MEAGIKPDDAESVKNLKNLYLGCVDTDAIEAAGYANFNSMVFGDAFGGWPMIQSSYDGASFKWEPVSGENFRRFVGAHLVTSYPYKDSFDTSVNVLYV